MLLIAENVVDSLGSSDNFPVYVALFTSLITLLGSLINAWINYLSIKKNNETLLKKVELDYSYNKITKDSEIRDKKISNFISAASELIQVEFVAVGGTVKSMIEFTTAYCELYSVINESSKVVLYAFYEEMHKANTNKSEDKRSDAKLMTDKLSILVLQLGRENNSNEN